MFFFSSFGIFKNKNKNEPMKFKKTTAIYVPRKGMIIASADIFTICGPMIAEANPPAITYDIALGLKLLVAVSAAANR